MPTRQQSIDKRNEDKRRLLAAFKRAMPSQWLHPAPRWTRACEELQTDGILESDLRIYSWCANGKVQLRRAYRLRREGRNQETYEQCPCCRGLGRVKFGY